MMSAPDKPEGVFEMVRKTFAVLFILACLVLDTMTMLMVLIGSWGIN